MTSQRVAEELLWPIWRGMPDAYKIKYARSIWQQFEDNIRSAAYTSSPALFFERICRRLGVELRAEDLARVTAILADDPKPLLQILREEATMLTLLCRLKNQERKEQRNAQDVPVRDDRDGTLFDQS
jgi:hypothetical protein